jgi:hypothetical protein
MTMSLQRVNMPFPSVLTKLCETGVHDSKTEIRLDLGAICWPADQETELHTIPVQVPQDQYGQRHSRSLVVLLQMHILLVLVAVLHLHQLSSPPMLILHLQARGKAWKSFHTTRTRDIASSSAYTTTNRASPFDDSRSGNGASKQV